MVKLLSPHASDLILILETRTKIFALNIIRLSSSMPNSIENRVIKNQIVKSGTSIGANYREANKSRSKADFMNRIRICQAEANETIYWLELISESNDQKIKILEELIREANELLAIFTSITNKLRS